MSRDAIEIREYERSQLVEFIPQVIERYEDAELDDRAEAFEHLQDAFEEPHDDQMYDLGHDLWDEIALGLEELDETRASWLATKIARRAELSAPLMGFTTAVPVGVRMTGEVPARADFE